MLLEDIAQLLDTHGVADYQSGIFYYLPTTPDNVVVLYEYPGDAPVHVKQVVQPVLERPRLQVTVRNLSADAARDKIEQVYRLLSGFSGHINGTRYARIEAVQSPFWLFRDENRHTAFNNNYRIWKDLSPTS